MKLFIPAVGYRIRLTQDWTFKLFHERRNESLLKFIVAEYKPKWYFGDKKMPHEVTSLPAGTLLEIDRVYVRTINKRATTEEEDYDSVTFKVVDSKKKVRFWTKLDDVNNVEYEIPPDVTASKDQAREAAKVRQKKLTKESCRDLVRNVFYYGERKTASWLTPKLRKTLDALAEEYKTRQRPLEVARIDKMLEREKAEMKFRFEGGHLHVAMNEVEALKKLTFEDYWTQHEQQWRRNRGVNDRLFETNYFVPHTLLGSRSKSSFKQLPTGERLRQFRGATVEDQRTYAQDAVDFSDMYVNIITNADDTEILRIEAGLDEKVATP